MRYAGALTGLLAGLFVAVVLGLAELGDPEAFSVARAFSLLPILAALGLLYDVVRSRYPAFWQSRHPDHLWMSWLFKTTLYWTVAFPLARLLQDLATYSEVSQRVPADGPADLFPYFGNSARLLGFLVAQAVFGTAFGVAFTFLYRRLRDKT
jgi:hypothetical protein